MAFRRSISFRVTLLRQRFHPSFSYILHDDDRKCQPPAADPLTRPAASYFLEEGTYNSNINLKFQDKRFSSLYLLPGIGPSLCRHMSSTVGGGSDKFEYINDVADVLTEKGVEVAQVPSVSEVAIAAADSFYPVAALQYLIDGVHSFTGLHWYGVSPFTPFKGLFIQGPIFISFFTAISNMAEKVPSFKGGGAFWFTDLTTPDSLYIFPILTSLIFLITVECNMQEGMEGNSVAGTMKNVSRVLAVLTIPFTMSFPKAIFCYWVTSNLFSLMYGLVLKRPSVKEFLGLPKLPAAPPSATQSSFSLSSLFKQFTPTTSEASLPVESSKFADRRTSSSSVISQRLKSVEKEVKRRKKNKKR
ncbi:PREDICTED: mitochondrial inner membrane protein OXA1-like isoform X3 [Nelumbo nucifera]|uniref:Mitochondrial inner membrane protein OXA1-like isoform X3 n=1 Tax=Nelumbo nucifera TaxID=4432 RepID=A0A1U8BDM8_NELNU|nr:PREDICTED: mitochondrial inner membrane protein OXA1-like isoform X3 [Nelumbo nucifera]